MGYCFRSSLFETKFSRSIYSVSNGNFCNRHIFLCFLQPFYFSVQITQYMEYIFFSFVKRKISVSESFRLLAFSSNRAHLSLLT